MATEQTEGSGSTKSGTEGNNIIQVAKGYRKLNFIRLCRIPVDGFSPGHYWIEFIHEDENDVDPYMQEARKKKLTEKEIDKLTEKPTMANGFRESYGWYPVGTPFSIAGAWPWNKTKLISEEGVVNGDVGGRRKKDKKETLTHKDAREAGRKQSNNNRSTRAFDPHQNGHFNDKNINFISTPVALPGDSRTDAQIMQDIRNFADSFYKNHSDTWSWLYDDYDEVNCHTFLFLLLAENNLADPECIGSGKDKHFRDFFDDLTENQDEDEVFKKRQALLDKLKQISEKAKNDNK